MLDTNIIIEIGNTEQKELIKKEIICFIEIISKTFEKWFDVLIIPENFEKTIRELTSDQNYSVIRRRINVQAKSILDNKDKTLVLNPQIFTSDYDTQIRFHQYFHETNHFINAQAKNSFEDLSIADKIYMENISFFYEEYCSERFSHAICEHLFSSKSPHYMKFLNGCYQGHYDNVLDMGRKYNEIRKILNDFRYNHDGDRFIREINPLIEPIILSYFYLLAFQKEAISYLQIKMNDFPMPFNQPASMDIAELCHQSYPQSFEVNKAIEKTRRFFSQFGFELKPIRDNLLWIGIVDV